MATAVDSGASVVNLRRQQSLTLPTYLLTCAGPAPATVLLRLPVAELLRQRFGEYLDMMVTLLQQRQAGIGPSPSLIPVRIFQAPEGDRRVPVDTRCRAQFTFGLPEASRRTSAAEPPSEAAARSDHL